MTTPATPGSLLLRGRVVTPDGVLDDGVVRAEGGLITDVLPAAAWPDAALPAPSARLVLPGLVDTHCHGGGGYGFPDADVHGVRAAVREHLGQGTTALVASVVSAPADALAARMELLAALVEAGELAGIHLEGPFLSPAHRGAHDPAAVLPGDPELLDRLLRLGRGTVRSVTLAPETARVDELVAVLGRHGALVAIGHTGASPDQVRRVVRAAGTPVVATHLFNAMPPWRSREPGPVPALLAAAARGEVVVELVADGVHLADGTVAAVFDLAGARQVALVTDAMAAAGMPDGRYRLGALDVAVVDGVARLAGEASGALAGGTARLLDVVRRVVRHAGVDLASAVAAASSTPARLLGLADRGALRPGAGADVLVTDPDLRPLAVAVAGSWTTSPPY